jgi:hypothetical protein
MATPCHSITSSARASIRGMIFKAERLSSFDVDHKLELGWLHS